MGGWWDGGLPGSFLPATSSTINYSTKCASELNFLKSFPGGKNFLWEELGLSSEWYLFVVNYSKYRNLNNPS